MQYIIHPRPEVPESLIQPFREMADVYSLSCVISDAMSRECTMDPQIKPRAAAKKIIGPALTVKLTPGDVVDCLGIFSMAKPGDVVVIDAFGEKSTSIWGGLMSGLARNAGIAGAVIDGSCRDTDEAQMLGFPISSRYVGPRAAHTATSGRREPIAFNVPVVCGGIIVNPGDLVVADEIGVAVIPREKLAEIYPLARNQADLEIRQREAIMRGATAETLLEQFGRI